MTAAAKYLENIKGLLIYLKSKNGSLVSLKELLRKQEKEPDVFKYMLEDYHENAELVLQNHEKQRNARNLDFIKEALVSLNSIESDDKFNSELKKAAEYFENLMSKIPTRFQELYSFGTVHNLSDNLLKAVTLLEYDIAISPVIGTVSTDSVNACTFTLENDEPVIIVEEDILSFIHLFSKIFVQCLSLGEENENGHSLILKKEEIIKNIENKPEILLRFKDFLTSYINEGSPRKSEQYYLKQDARYSMCSMLIISAELFLVGHELGHIIAKHHSSKRKLSFYNQDFEVACENSDWEKEFEADRIGLHLAMQAMASLNFPVDYCYLGIEPFLTVHNIALKAKRILQMGDEDISSEFNSHPPNIKRKEHLRALFKQMVSEEEYERGLFIPNTIDETMGYIWEKTKDVFYQHKNLATT